MVTTWRGYQGCAFSQTEGNRVLKMHYETEEWREICSRENVVDRLVLGQGLGKKFGELGNTWQENSFNSATEEGNIFVRRQIQLACNDKWHISDNEVYILRTVKTFNINA